MSCLLHVLSSTCHIFPAASTCHIFLTASTCHIFRASTYPIFCAASTDMSYLPCGFYVSYVPRLLCVISSAASTCHIFRCSFDMSYLPCFISSDAALTCHIFCALTCPMFRGFYMSYLPMQLLRVLCSAAFACHIFPVASTCHIFRAASTDISYLPRSFSQYVRLKSATSHTPGNPRSRVLAHVTWRLTYTYTSTRPIFLVAWLLHVLLSLQPGLSMYFFPSRLLHARD
jgi:hypothetical protein